MESKLTLKPSKASLLTTKQAPTGILNFFRLSLFSKLTQLSKPIGKPKSSPSKISKPKKVSVLAIKEGKIGNISYIIKRSSRCKRIAVLIDKNNLITLRIPSHTPEERGKAFLIKIWPKLEKSINQRRVKQSDMRQVNAGDEFNIHRHQIIFAYSSPIKSPIKVIKSTEVDIIHLTEDDVNKDMSIKTTIKVKKEVQKTLFKIAHKILITSLQTYASNCNLTYATPRIRNTKTIWGSCSKTNNITLALKLVLANKEMIRYVILHELAHTKHKHHKPLFWQFLSILLGENAKTVDKKLKSSHHPLENFLH